MKRVQNEKKSKKKFKKVQHRKVQHGNNATSTKFIRKKSATC